LKTSQEKSKKINTKTKKTQDQPGRKFERKEEQKQDFFHGLFSSRASRKKNAYIKKNVQKNRKIVKNLLMYDKKNFLPHIQKKSPKKQNRPQQVKKTKKNEKNPKQPEKF
jgi:DNA polymerase IIIc chi subunit